MRIGIDLDNTLFANTIVRDTVRPYGYGLPTNYDLTCYPDDLREQCFWNFKDSTKMHDLQPYPYNAETLQRWKDEGHTLIVVTARSLHFTEATTAMVKEYYPMIDEVVLVESFDKRNAIRSLELDVYIDDHFDCVLQAVEVGVETVVLISNEETPYNYHGVPVIQRLWGATIHKSVNQVVL